MNLKRMMEDICALGRESRELKALLRRTWHEPMGDAQRRACVVRYRTTELLVCRAHLRGRVHVARKPRDFAGASWDALAYATVVAARVAEAYPSASAEVA